MLSLAKWTRAGAIGVAAALLAHSHAEAHAVCGSRIFPATLAIDDPGVSDELALPTVTYDPKNAGGNREVDATFSYTKTIFPNFGDFRHRRSDLAPPGRRGVGEPRYGSEIHVLVRPHA